MPKAAKKKTTRKVSVADIPCYATDFDTDYHYSNEWGNKLVDIWIKTKQAFMAEGNWAQGVFRKELQRQMLDQLDITDAFLQGCAEQGFTGELDSELYEEFFSLQMANVFSLIPSSLHAEFCWVPEWRGGDVDDLMYTQGLRSDRYRSSYIEDVQPGNWLRLFLELVNCSSVDLIGEAINERGEEGRVLAEKCAKANFKVDKDQNRAQLMNPHQVISAIENAYSNAFPVVHCEINLKALFEMDPSKPMTLKSAKAHVHVGLHEPLNGAGYLDTYPGQVTIPADAVGFFGANRWKYGINKVYGLVRSAFYTIPEQKTGV